MHRFAPMKAGFRKDFHVKQIANIKWFKQQLPKGPDPNVPETWWEVNMTEWTPVWNDTQYSNQDPMYAIQDDSATSVYKCAPWCFQQKICDFQACGNCSFC
jgi:hypothetical protein